LRTSCEHQDTGTPKLFTWTIEETGMDLKIKGKRALVTGSTQGIGAAVAMALAAEGCEVVVNGRFAETVEQTVLRIRQAGGWAIAEEGEGFKVADADAGIGGGGSVDILVNNAGGAAGTTSVQWFDTDAAAWLGSFERNVFSVSHLIRRLAPGMRERKWGRIIQ